MTYEQALALRPGDRVRAVVSGELADLFVSRVRHEDVAPWVFVYLYRGEGSAEFRKPRYPHEVHACHAPHAAGAFADWLEERGFADAAAALRRAFLPR